MQLADPSDAGVLIWLPAADALALDNGAPVRLFLHTQPLHPLSAHLLLKIALDGRPRQHQAAIGRVVIDGDARAWQRSALERAASVLIRESGS